MLTADAAGSVARRFGLGSGAALSDRPVARGELGQVWRLTTVDGTWAVKEPFEPQQDLEAETMAAYHDAVVAAGVPAPAIVRSTTGAILADVDGAQVRVYPWVELHDADTDLDTTDLGTLVAAIHGVRRATSDPADAWYTEPVGADRWDDLVARLGDRGAPHADRLAELRDELVAVEALLAPPEDLQICHRDLWADNVRATASGGLCVIDWENCGPADPGQELAMVLFEYARSDARRARPLHDAYTGAGGPGRVVDRGSFSMAIGALHHIGEQSCEQWLAAATDAERARAEGRIEEFLGEPLTRALVDDLLAAVGS